MKQTKVSVLKEWQGWWGKGLIDWARAGLAVVLAVAASVDMFAQASPESSNVRQNIDAASNFLGGLVGILFVGFIVRGFLKKKKQPPRTKNEE